jgi:ParB/RepB/Spo0J family partition protein
MELKLKLKKRPAEISQVVPSAKLLKLELDKIKPSTHNPRHLFDPEPLLDLKNSIRNHGVLVPIIVFQLKGQDKFGILDGERRYRCCKDLQEEGIEIIIPANIVEPPDKISSILYMFSIHNFREAWELMPTALSLKIVMEELGTTDNSSLNRLTGLSEPQIERCKILLSFPERYQKMSLDPDPKIRIPSNFWIEVYPVLDLCERELKKLIEKYSRWGILDKLVEKYQAKKIKSVIHFRRIMEAYDIVDEAKKKTVLDRLQNYILDIDLETRRAFDEFVVDNRRIQGAVSVCNDFIAQIKKFKIDYTHSRKEVINALQQVIDFAEKLKNKLEGSDPNAPEEDN